MIVNLPRCIVVKILQGDTRIQIQKSKIISRSTGRERRISSSQPGKHWSQIFKMDALKGCRLWPVFITDPSPSVCTISAFTIRRFRVPEAQLNMTLFHSSCSKVVRMDFGFQIGFRVPEFKYGMAKGKEGFLESPSLKRQECYR